MQRAILSAFALVLLTPFAAQAQDNKECPLGDTTWVTLSKSDSGKIQVERLAFDGSGGFSLTTTQGNKVVSRISGTFTAKSNLLILKANAKEIRMTIRSQDDKLMILLIGGSETRFAKVK